MECGGHPPISTWVRAFPVAKSTYFLEVLEPRIRSSLLESLARFVVKELNIFVLKRCPSSR